MWPRLEKENKNRHLNNIGGSAAAPLWRARARDESAALSPLVILLCHSSQLARAYNAPRGVQGYARGVGDSRTRCAMTREIFRRRGCDNCCCC